VVVVVAGTVVGTVVEVVVLLVELAVVDVAAAVVVVLSLSSEIVLEQPASQMTKLPTEKRVTIKKTVAPNQKLKSFNLSPNFVITYSILLALMNAPIERS
jgi:hypothetical protein